MPGLDEYFFSPERQKTAKAMDDWLDSYFGGSAPGDTASAYLKYLGRSGLHALQMLENLQSTYRGIQEAFQPVMAGKSYLPDLTRAVEAMGMGDRPTETYAEALGLEEGGLPALGVDVLADPMGAITLPLGLAAGTAAKAAPRVATALAAGAPEAAASAIGAARGAAGAAGILGRLLRSAASEVADDVGRAASRLKYDLGVSLKTPTPEASIGDDLRRAVSDYISSGWRTFEEPKSITEKAKSALSKIEGTVEDFVLKGGRPWERLSPDEKLLRLESKLKEATDFRAPANIWEEIAEGNPKVAANILLRYASKDFIADMTNIAGEITPQKLAKAIAQGDGLVNVVGETVVENLMKSALSKGISSTTLKKIKSLAGNAWDKGLEELRQIAKAGLGEAPKLEVGAVERVLSLPAAAAEKTFELAGRGLSGLGRGATDWLGDLLLRRRYEIYPEKIADLGVERLLSPEAKRRAVRAASTDQDLKEAAVRELVSTVTGAKPQSLFNVEDKAKGLLNTLNLFLNPRTSNIPAAIGLGIPAYYAARPMVEGLLRREAEELPQEIRDTSWQREPTEEEIIARRFRDLLAGKTVPTSEDLTNIGTGNAAVLLRDMARDLSRQAPGALGEALQRMIINQLREAIPEDYIEDSSDFQLLNQAARKIAGDILKNSQTYIQQKILEELDPSRPLKELEMVQRMLRSPEFWESDLGEWVKENWREYGNPEDIKRKLFVKALTRRR